MPADIFTIGNCVAHHRWTRSMPYARLITLQAQLGAGAMGSALTVCESRMVSAVQRLTDASKEC